MQWNLIIMRKEKGLKQTDMADMLNISADAYGKKERGQLQFVLDEMFFLSNYFDKPMDQIFLPRNFGKSEKAN